MNKELFKLMEVTHDKISPALREKLEGLQRQHGVVTSKMLSGDDMQEILGTMQEVATEGMPDGVVGFMEKKMTEELNGISEVLIEGLEKYTAETDGLELPFHVPAVHGDCLKLYNACAKFCRTYMSVELEHGECLKKAIAREKEDGKEDS